MEQNSRVQCGSREELEQLGVRKHEREQLEARTHGREQRAGGHPWVGI
jgi:hypothetical protein